jgi:hypothetical protein
MQNVSDKKPPRWGILVASKKKLRQILTGEFSPKEKNEKEKNEKEDETLADDLLYGAPAISEFTGLTEPQVYHQQKALGIVRLGRTNEAA